MAGQDEVIGQIMGEHLLRAAEDAEEKLDDEIRKMDELDDDDLEKIRRKRIDEMKKKREVETKWRAHGHGKYTEVADTKDFFAQVKGAPRCIVHFYRGATRRCEVVDRHLGILAPKHVECKVLRIDAEKNPFVAEKLHIWMLPSIVLIKDGKTEHTIVGFDDFGGSDDFETETMEGVLAAHGVFLESYC
mmetsp:Transcript_79837/g.222122  ORF Transcript_79837/g.222122 Transcript_79837/m.222122 type:complete len:189 (-) Transcript_79837:141-707(-)